MRPTMGEVIWTREADVMSIAARFYGRLYAFAVCLTGSESDAADLPQQTFL
jgi:DNA-directed RNA polymerase specialized sigma24 family protein